MSFDLKIFNGDLVIGSNGDLQKVQDSDKLVQDIIKLLNTEIGSNVFFPWYGSMLGATMIGNALPQDFTVNMAENQIRSGIETIQSLQRAQMASQNVTAGELLAALKSVLVDRSQTDPTFFSVSVVVLTKALKTAFAKFDVSI